MGKQEMGWTSFMIFLFIVLLIFFDQATKTYFTGKSYFEDFFISIHYSENLGSAFGLFAGFNLYSFMVIFLSLAVLLFIFFYYEEFLQSLTSEMVLVFLSAGILGNLIDRLAFSYVRDFIALQHLFIFNLADLYLTIAIGIFLFNKFSEDKILKTKN